MSSTDQHTPEASETTDPVSSSGDVHAGDSTQAPQVPSHPVLDTFAEIARLVGEVAGVPAWSMTPAQHKAALLAAHQVTSQLDALRLRVLAAAEHTGAVTDQGADVASWVRSETRTDPRTARADVRLAVALDDDSSSTGFGPTQAALQAGAINADQAGVIVKAVQRLTSEYDDLPPGTHAAAEAHLLDLAAGFGPRELARLGKRLYEVVCPEAADAAEGQVLEREEEQARRTAFLAMRDNGDGTVEGSFRLPTLHAQVLGQAVAAFTAPRRLGEAGLDPKTGRRLPATTLAGQGFMQVLEHLDPATLPDQNGSPFTIVVTLPLDALTSGLGAAGLLPSGERISAGEARRLAARAGIIPAVLGGRSMPLDLGRKRRLHSPYQRLANTLVHHGRCAEHRCDRPWTQTHHLHPWHQGGRTDQANALPLCPAHHYMADHPGAWNLRRHPDGSVRFTRRQ